GPGTLLFNPAAGVRYRNEFSFTLLDHPHEKDAGRLALTRNGGTISVSGERNAALTPGISAGGGQDRLRFGLATTWLPIEGNHRARDYRAGLYSAAAPGLLFGAVIDHVRQPVIGSGRLDRQYTL